MKMISVLVIVTSCLWSVQGKHIHQVLYYQGQCTTPQRTVGQCISLNDCPQLLALKTKSQKTPEEKEIFILSRIQCTYIDSFEAFYNENMQKVCCEVNNTKIEEDHRCFTPDGNEGTCVDLNSCPTLLNLSNSISEENQTYLRTSKCEGPTDNSVCCGPPRNQNVRPLETCDPTAAPPDPRTECCGVDSSSVNKIYGGNLTAIDQFPWLTLLEYYIRTGDKKIGLFCGGVLISGRYVLTAGHCTNRTIVTEPDNIRQYYGDPKMVRLGEYDISSYGQDCVTVEGGGTDCTNGSTVVPIEKVIRHPQYDPASKLPRHDIALLRLQFNAPYTDFIRPICLPTSDISLSKRPLMLQAAGWGATEKKSFSNIKLFVNLPYKTLEECQPAHNVKLWRGHICAGGEVGKSTCMGDSGGPLMSVNNGIYTVVGITSFGKTICGLNNAPSVFTNVYEYLP